MNAALLLIPPAAAAPPHSRARTTWPASLHSSPVAIPIQVCTGVLRAPRALAHMCSYVQMWFIP